MARIGVFVCHCGLNIAGTVDVTRVADALRVRPGVVLATDYVYLCSEPGQALIRDAIKEHELDAVVVAACSPTMHEVTFRRAAAAAGLNPYRLEIANIREQVSWPHQNEPDKATRKAISTVRSIATKVRGDEPLIPLKLPITRRALVVGGGMAGMTAARTIADGGHSVILVERSSRLGGRVAQLSHAYLGPADAPVDLDRCVKALYHHPLVEVLISTEVSAFSGYVGNFTAGLSHTYPSQCRSGSAEPDLRHIEFGAVVLATGFDPYGVENLPEYGGGRIDDVLDSLQFEEMLRTGEILTQSGRPAREIVWVQCAGSRDPHLHRSYCSKICCMYVAKQAIAFRRQAPDGQAYVFYIDIRSQGRGYDEYVQQAMDEYGVVYLRGKVSKIVRRGHRLEVWGADTLSGSTMRLRADLVVLATAAVPSAGADDLGRLLRAPVDVSGFFAEAHPKLRPVESLTAGIFLAGSAQVPKDIAETVAHASGAAAKVLQLFSQDELVAEPTIAFVDEELCVGCERCIPACPYDARSLHPWRNVVTVNAALCQNCGACVVACPNKATAVHNQTPEQMLAVIEAMLESV